MLISPSVEVSQLILSGSGSAIVSLRPRRVLLGRAGRLVQGRACLQPFADRGGVVRSSTSSSANDASTFNYDQSDKLPQFLSELDQTHRPSAHRQSPQQESNCAPTLVLLNSGGWGVHSSDPLD